jgi:hypothetical protein
MTSVLDDYESPPLFDLVLHSVPPPVEAGEPSKGHIPALAEIKRVLGLDLKDAVALVRGDLPARTIQGTWNELIPKAHKLLEVGCGVEMRAAEETL